MRKYGMKALYIQCMEREGDSKNGGLCHVCAPPLKRRRHHLVITVTVL